VVLAVLAGLLLLIANVAADVVARNRPRRLADQFGPEYDHAVATYGRRRGGQELEARREHVDQLTLRDLTADEHAELVQRWQTVQARFVDQPSAAVTEADAVIAETMRLRGYPIDDVADDERREADLSVAHPTEVGLYRDAAAIARRSRRNEATTEELRQAMVHYRSLFDSLAKARQGDGVDHARSERTERPPERPGERVGERRVEDDDVAPPVRPGERAAQPVDTAGTRR
jgi:hypothetical protein